MSSESFEEREEAEAAGVEIVEKEGEEEAQLVEGEALEEEFTLLYDVTRPEILEINMIAVDILSSASEGFISVDNAKKLHKVNVERRWRELVKAGTIIKKPKTRRARKAKKPEEAKKPKPRVGKAEKKPSKEKSKARKTGGSRE